MKKIKLISLVLALVMVLGLFAGCGNKTAEETKAPAAANAEPAAADTTAAPAAESGSITLGIWPEDTQTEAIAVHENTYVPAFNALHPDVEAIPAYYKYSPDTYVALATAGNAPTVFESWYTEPEKLIRNGLVKDITDILEGKGWLDSMSYP